MGKFSDRSVVRNFEQGRNCRIIIITVKCHINDILSFYIAVYARPHYADKECTCVCIYTPPFKKYQRLWKPTQQTRVRPIAAVKTKYKSVPPLFAVCVVSSGYWILHQSIDHYSTECRITYLLKKKWAHAALSFGPAIALLIFRQSERGSIRENNQETNSIRYGRYRVA